MLELTEKAGTDQFRKILEIVKEKEQALAHFTGNGFKDIHAAVRTAQENFTDRPNLDAIPHT